MDNYTAVYVGSIDRTDASKAYAIMRKEDGYFFRGYDFMGSADWNEKYDPYENMTKDEAQQIISDLNSADEPCVSPADKEYLLKTECDGIKQASIKTGKQIADIYDYDQLADIYSSLRVYDLDSLKEISLLNLVEPILAQKRWMEQEYRDYCDNVSEYGLDFEGRDE